jgi:hypothetical protein
MQWADLARRYRSAKSAFTITLIIGFIFLWPLWIIAYLEHNKMNDVKREVAAAGVDAETWARSIR